MAKLDTKALETNEIQRLMNNLQTELKQRENKEKKMLRTEFDKKLKQHGLSITDIYPELSGRSVTVARKGKRGRPAGSPNRKARPDAGKTVAAKYKHPKTGETWTGRGKPKRWVLAELEAKNITLDTFKNKKEYQAV